MQPMKDPSRHRITDMHGSAKMNDLLGKRKAQREGRESEAEQKAERAEGRAAAKAAKDAASKAKFDAWLKCRGGCCCGEGGAAAIRSGRYGGDADTLCGAIRFVNVDFVLR